MNMSEAARTLEYQAVTDYRGALGVTVSWLVDAVQGRNWQEVFPSFLRINGRLAHSITPPKTPG